MDQLVHQDRADLDGVCGHLWSEEYQAKDGTKRRAMKIVADQLEVRLLSKVLRPA